MDFTDPLHSTEENIEITGYEPVLGGQLAEMAVWVDESKCIGFQSVSYTNLKLPTKRIV